MMMQEETKRTTVPSYLKAGLTKIVTASSEGFGYEEEDLDEKCPSSTNLFGYNLKLSMQQK